jgi:hypothetical protein
MQQSENSPFQINETPLSCYFSFHSTGKTHWIFTILHSDNKFTVVFYYISMEIHLEFISSKTLIFYTISAQGLGLKLVIIDNQPYFTSFHQNQQQNNRVQQNKNCY